MYVLAIDSPIYPYSDSQLRADNPQVSFPSVITDALRAEFGVFPVVPVNKPAGEVVTEGVPLLIDGVWTQQWAVRNYTLSDLQQLCDEKSRQIDTDFTTACNAIRAGYPADEIQSWPQQQTQAEAYADNNSASVPLLESMAATRGLTVTELATRILANAAAYSSAYGAALGTKQRRKAELAAIDLSAPGAFDNINNI